MKDRIVEASVHLFSNHGFKGTSTREIARLADVNETSLFRHFHRKEDLFWSALNSQLERLRMRKELELGLREVKHPTVVIPLVAEFLVDAARYQSPALKLLTISLIEMQPTAELVWRERVGPVVRSISDYLEQCVRAGTLRCVDTSIAAAALCSTVLGHEYACRAGERSSKSYVNSSNAAAEYSKFLLSALLPNESTPSVRDRAERVDLREEYR